MKLQEMLKKMAADVRENGLSKKEWPPFEKVAQARMTVVLSFLKEIR